MNLVCPDGLTTDPSPQGCSCPRAETVGGGRYGQTAPKS